MAGRLPVLGVESVGAWVKVPLPGGVVAGHEGWPWLGDSTRAFGSTRPRGSMRCAGSTWSRGGLPRGESIRPRGGLPRDDRSANAHGGLSLTSEGGLLAGPAWLAPIGDGRLFIAGIGVSSSKGGCYDALFPTRSQPVSRSSSYVTASSRSDPPAVRSGSGRAGTNGPVRTRQIASARP